MAWSPSYASAADLAGWLRIEADDSELALATEAASRAIDKAAGRQFGRVDAPEQRHFEAQLYRGRWHVDLPDLMLTPTAFTTEDVTPITNYQLGPRNAPSEGRPWTSAVMPWAGHGVVTITARWGWTSVPDAIKQATLIQAARFYDRRINVSGPQTSKRVDDIALGWSVGGSGADLDPEALSIVRPFRRLWVAV
jgi:hypothetical protein